MGSEAKTIIDNNKTLFTAGAVLVIAGGVWWGASQATSATVQINNLQNDITELKTLVKDNTTARNVQYSDLESRVRTLEVEILKK